MSKRQVISKNTGKPVDARKAWSPERRAKMEAMWAKRAAKKGRKSLNQMTKEEKRAYWREEHARRAGRAAPLRKKLKDMTPEERKARNREYSAAHRARKVAQNGAQEIPLDMIPDKLPAVRAQSKRTPAALFNGTGHNKLADKVHAEYDINNDQMTLVLGKLRLPFRVKV